MPFAKFKERHGGQGPFAAFYESATGGRGLFGRLGLKQERSLTDQLISRVQEDDSLTGLTALAEAGRAPMTREQHAEFRAGLLQSAMNVNTANEGYEGFTQRQAGLRTVSVGPEDVQQLDLLDTQGRYAHSLLNSGDPLLRAQGASLMNDVMQGQNQFATTNEAQRLQLEEVERSGRDQRRGEIQSLVDSTIVVPMIEDRANYGAINAQLIEEGAVVAPPSLVSAVLEYAGASLRQSDDGNWSFSLGPVGIQDTNLPAMTYSELRNRLNAAQQGREQAMQGALGQIGGLAEKQGYGINGTDVEDLMFPLASSATPAREREFKPQSAVSRSNTWLEAFGITPPDNSPNFLTPRTAERFGADESIRRGTGFRGTIDRSGTDQLPTNE